MATQTQTDDPNAVVFCTVCNRVMLRYGVDDEGRCEDCIEFEPGQRDVPRPDDVPDPEPDEAAEAAEQLA